MSRPPLKVRLGVALGRRALDAILHSCRYTEEGRERFEALRAEGPVIIAAWHGRLLTLAWRHRDRGYAPMISQSRDGDYIAGVVAAWGYHPVRGSTSRGGSAALRELVRCGRTHTLVLTPDGPRGPRQRLQPGVLLAARLTGLPIVPLAAGADRAWWLGGWDRFLVPKPYARVHLLHGEPHRVARDASQADMAALGTRLEADLNRLTARADAHFTHG